MPSDVLDISAPDLPDPLLVEAYEQAATRNVLAAVNNDVFYGYFSVCADANGHGSDSTFPGLDWGQSAEALLWLGRENLIRASWDYVKSFQRDDGLLPFAILPTHKGTTVNIDGFPMKLDERGGAYKHWVPGDPFRTLAAVTFVQMADAIARHTRDPGWLRAQADALKLTMDWLERLTTAQGLVGGAGYYLERPVRIEHDGVTQCYTANAFGLAAGLFDAMEHFETAARCRDLAGRVTTAFRSQFWDRERGQCIESIHPERGPIRGHGLTDVDWIAVGSGLLSDEQIQTLWPRLRSDPDFLYRGMPTGIATRPETYEPWEYQQIDRHDLAAMGRVWYLESWARARMNDGAGLIASLNRVAEAGRDNGWHWVERYYSQRTPELGPSPMNTYVEYPANLIRILNRFVLGVSQELDGSLRLAPTVPSEWWDKGFGQTLKWAGRSLRYRFTDRSLRGSYRGDESLHIRARIACSADPNDARTLDIELPASPSGRDFEVSL